VSSASSSSLSLAGSTSFWISLLSVEIITSLFQSMTVQSQATNPNLAILADRKEWRIKTIGLGQECKSSCCEWEKKGTVLSSEGKFLM